MQSFSIEIWNDRPRPHVVWIEPWANDVTLLPGQRLVVTNHSSELAEKPHFVLVETDGNTQVYVEHGDYPELLLDGVPPDECGHNRQAAIDAGIYPA